MQAMLDVDFSTQLNRLKSVYGNNHFQGERRQAIWSSVKSLSAYEFSIIVDKFINEQKFAPLPKDFMKEVYECKRSKYNSRNISNDFRHNFDRDPIGKVNCSDCYDTGLCFVIVDQESNLQMLAKCHCEVSKNYPREFPSVLRGSGIGDFKIAKFPSDHFKAKKLSGNVDIHGLKVSKDFVEIMRRWQAKVQLSYEFWKNFENKIVEIPEFS